MVGKEDGQHCQNECSMQQMSAKEARRRRAALSQSPAMQSALRATVSFVQPTRFLPVAPFRVYISQTVEELLKRPIYRERRMHILLIKKSRYSSCGTNAACTVTFQELITCSVTFLFATSRTPDHDKAKSSRRRRPDGIKYFL